MGRTCSVQGPCTLHVGHPVGRGGPVASAFWTPPRAVFPGPARPALPAPRAHGRCHGGQRCRRPWGPPGARRRATQSVQLLGSGPIASGWPVRGRWTRWLFGDAGCRSSAGRLARGACCGAFLRHAVAAAAQPSLPANSVARRARSSVYPAAAVARRPRLWSGQPPTQFRARRDATSVRSWVRCFVALAMNVHGALGGYSGDFLGAALFGMRRMFSRRAAVP